MDYSFSPNDAGQVHPHFSVKQKTAIRGVWGNHRAHARAGARSR